MAVERLLRTLDESTLLALGGALFDVTLVISADGIIRDARFGPDFLVPDAGLAWCDRPLRDTVSAASGASVSRLLADAATGVRATPVQLDHHAPAPGGVIPVSYHCARMPGSAALVALGRDLRVDAALKQRVLQAEQAIHLEHQRLRSAGVRHGVVFRDGTTAAVLVEAAGAAIVESNPAAERLLSVTGDPLAGRSLLECFPATEAAALRRLLEHASAGRAEARAVLHPADGRPLLAVATIFSLGATPVVHLALEAGPVAPPAVPGRMAGVVTDVIDRSPDGFVVLDGEGGLVHANPAFLAMWGAGPEPPAAGLPLHRWLGRERSDAEALLAFLRDSGSARCVRTTLRRVDGVAVEVELSAAGFVDRPARGYAVCVRPTAARRSLEASVVSHLRSQVGKVAMRELVRDVSERLERHCIEATLALTRSNISTSAALLGLSRQSLYTKMRRFRGRGPSWS